MRAYIEMANGESVLAIYVWTRHEWDLDHGHEPVPVPPGDSAFGALRRVYPNARLVSEPSSTKGA